MFHLSPKARSPKRRTPILVDASSPLPSCPIWAQGNFDGACAPNPGNMSIGYLIDVAGKRLVEVGAYVGHGTNNRAEWIALISTMKHLLRLGLFNADLYTDSTIVCGQFNGKFKVKKSLQRYHQEGMALKRLFQNIKLTHVVRENNGGADALSRQIIYKSPILPDPEPLVTGASPRKLLLWQAAAMRVWRLRHNMGIGTLASIFGVEPNIARNVVLGEAYRGATFDGYLTYLNNLPNLPMEVTLEPQAAQTV